jgi:transposase-like protein/IS1 family transposase
MTCHSCQIECKKFGKNPRGRQRYRCRQCSKTFSDLPQRPLGEMRIPLDRALLCIQLIVEGNSIRSAERITGVHRDTILTLLVKAGERCEKLLADMITRLQVRDVECDEIWGYVGMKEKEKEKVKGKTYANVDTLGDAYTYVAIERNSKLILAWHLGRRSRPDTLQFIVKLRRATRGKFQLSTDGWTAYPDAIERVFGIDVNYAQMVKVYAAARDGEQRYSPAEVVDVEVIPRIGMLDYERICTSHVERQNLTMRMQIRRLTRLTNAFSKKWDNLKAAIALHFAFYNFCRMHKTIRCTPAMESGLTNHVWSLAELIGG